MTYLVITVVQVEADSPEMAAEIAVPDRWFIQPFKSITEAAVESAIHGSAQVCSE